MLSAHKAPLCPSLPDALVLEVEKVGQHRDSLRKIVSKIAAEGEKYRKRAVEARHQAGEESEARQAERERRKDLANEIKFD